MGAKSLSSARTNLERRRDGTRRPTICRGRRKWRRRTLCTGEQRGWTPITVRANATLPRNSAKEATRTLCAAGATLSKAPRPRRRSRSVEQTTETENLAHRVLAALTHKESQSPATTPDRERDGATTNFENTLRQLVEDEFEGKTRTAREFLY